MKKPSKRFVLIASLAALAAAGIAGGALAASGTFDPAAERQAFLNDAAGRLGVSSDKLDAALKAAAVDRVDAALAAGRITKAEADAMKSAINSGKLPLGMGVPGMGFRMGGGGIHTLGGTLDAAATYLGLTEDQLQTQLESGKSLADVAKAQGKSVDGLKQALTADLKTKLDQAVKDGRLTQSQADSILAKVSASLDDLINGTLPKMPTTGDGFHGPFGFRIAPSGFRVAPGGFRFAPGGFHQPFPAVTPPGTATPTA
jgi:hypothetical protein